MNTRALATVAAAIVVLVLGVALLYAYGTQATPATASAAPTPTATVAVATAPATPAPTAAPTASITGLFRYPAGGFLPALTVYAISVANPSVFYSVATPRFVMDATPPPSGTPGSSGRYTIAGITPGTYYVFAYRDSDFGGPPDLPGLYSQWGVCVRPTSSAQPVNPTPNTCSDHSLVPVTVRPGETVSGIDIAEWLGYPTTVSYPPRPAR